ncbi:hypothetical protein [Nakamurella antarctica]|nr:hypothetical protein [Nakamurella antarctica]
MGTSKLMFGDLVSGPNPGSGVKTPALLMAFELVLPWCRMESA